MNLREIIQKFGLLQFFIIKGNKFLGIFSC